MATHIFPTIEEWCASKDKFRVVANGFSRPFPQAHRITGNTPLNQFYKSNVESQMRTILARYGIYKYWMDFHRLPETFIPEYFIFPPNLVHHTDQVTLLIKTESGDSKNWKILAEEIFSIFANGGFNKDQVEVEIRNPKRMNYNISSILDDDDYTLAACQSVRSELLDQIRTYCGSAWSSVAFHLRSHISDDSELKKPTILVYCHKGSCCDFDALESALLKILSKANAGLSLELLPGSVVSAYNPLSTPIPPAYNISREPFIEASIGLKGDKERSGTLGGWFMLNLPGGLTSKVALTSHSLFGGIGSQLGTINTEESEIERLQVEHPAPSDTMATIKHLEAFCLKPDCPSSTTQWLKDLRDATTAPSIGHLISASGYRLNDNRHRMDWALIQVSSYMAKNRPPLKDFLESHTFDPNAPHYNVTPDSIITNLCDLIPGSWAVKGGKCTGSTCGDINRLPRIIQWDDGQESEEADFVGWAQNFAQAGDTGSFVVDSFGNLVGLLIAADPVTSCAFVTPIREVVADVKAMTGGNLTLA